MRLESPYQRRDSFLLIIGLLIGIWFYIYGSIHSSLFSQSSWPANAVKQFEVFSLGFLAATPCILLFRHHLKTMFFFAFGAVLVLAFGFGAMSACFLMILSSYCTGLMLLKVLDCRMPHESLSETLIILITGLGIEAGVAQVLGRYPVNYPAVYLSILLFPVFIHYHDVISLITRFVTWLHAPSPFIPATVLSVLLLMFILCWHMVYASYPERDGDALVGHLFQAFSFAHKHIFAGDFQHNSISLMPLGAEALYGVVYLFGDEPAARLINFCCYLFTTALLYAFLRQRIQVLYAVLLCCIFASIPVGLLETSSNFIDNPLQLFFVAAFMALIVGMQSTNNKLPWMLLAMINVFASITVKLMGVVYAVPMFLLMGYFAYKERKTFSAKYFLLLALFALLFAFPYLYSYYESGNPVLPLLNHVFQSPYFFTDFDWKDGRWPVGFNIYNLYLFNFTSRCLEGDAGVIGSQFVIFSVATILLACVRRDRVIFMALFASFVFISIMMSNIVYSRYIYPILPLILVAFSVLYFSIEAYYPLVRRLLTLITVAVIAINIYFLPGAGWALKEPNAIALIDPSRKEQRAEIKIDSIINMLSGDKSRVLYAFSTYDMAAHLLGTSFSSDWRNFDAFHRIKNIQTDYTPALYETLFSDYNINFFVLRDSDDTVHYLDSHPEKYKRLAYIEHVMLYSVGSTIIK